MHFSLSFSELVRGNILFNAHDPSFTYPKYPILALLKRRNA